MTRRSPQDSAVVWMLRLHEGALDPDEQATFDAWIAHEGNSGALVTARRTWAVVGQLADDPAIAVERARILRRTGADRRRRLFAAAASIVAVLCTGAAFLLAAPWETARNSASTTARAAAGELIGTRVGERATVSLADGSLLTLNTDSAVRVAYTDQERRIVLERGQAFFEVAKHQPQPFVVDAGEQRVVATGTAFDVWLDPMRTQVVLVEGEVHVGVARASRRTDVIMHAGQRLVARPGVAPLLSTADLDQATSWTSGRLIFRDTPVREATREINRYSSRQVLIEDPAVGDLRVSGVFSTGQPAHFARALADIHPLTLRENAHGQILILAKRP